MSRSDGERLRRAHLDDVSTSFGLRRNVRKSEKGILVVYANTISRTETDEQTNEETAHDIHYIKGYMVFQCRADRWVTRALLQQTGAACPGPPAR